MSIDYSFPEANSIQLTNPKLHTYKNQLNFEASSQTITIKHGIVNGKTEGINATSKGNQRTISWKVNRKSTGYLCKINRASMENQSQIHGEPTGHL